MKLNIWHLLGILFLLFIGFVLFRELDLDWPSLGSDVPWLLIATLILITIAGVLLFTGKGRGTIVDGIKGIIVPVLIIGGAIAFLALTDVGRNLWHNLEAVTSGQPSVHTVAASVGKWSEPLEIRPGCRVNYDAGNGEVYRVQTRLYSPEWKNHVPGEDNEASEVRFMLLKEVGNRIPVTIHCS